MRPETATTRSVRCAVISTDGAFRKIVEQAVRHPDAGTTLEIEFGVPFAAFGNAELKALKGASPMRPRSRCRPASLRPGSGPDG